MQKIDYSLILACYNEGSTFEESLNKILFEVRQFSGNWEIVFVEDKSTDKTREVLARNLKKIPNSRVIFHKKNLGRGKSVTDGIQVSRGSICGFIDVDCEVSPSYIPLFIKEVENGCDMVVGKRYYERGFKSLTRVVASHTYAALIKVLLNIPVDDTEAGYKFFRKKTILPVLKKVKDKHWFWDTEICARANLAGLKITQIPVLFVRRHEKKSTVKIMPDTIRYIRSILEFKKQIANVKK